jgi:hypothetical protein
MDYSIYLKPKTYLNIVMNTGAGITSWKITERFEIGDENETITDNLKGFSCYVSPGIKYEYQFSPNVNFFGASNYSFDIYKSYWLKGNMDNKSQVNADWSGLRVLFGVEFGI